MTKSEITSMTDTELFVAFSLKTTQITKEAYNRGGETKKTSKELLWLTEECVKRFNLDAELLKEEGVL